VKLTTHLHLVPTSRMHGAVPTLPHTPSCHGAQLKHKDKFTFTFKDENGNLPVDPQSVLNRRKNFFNQLLNEHGVHVR
jgi:hypothetical protein